MRLALHISRLFTNPDVAVRLHAGMFIFWLLMAVPSVIWWHNSIMYVIFISLYAIWQGHISALQAALADRRIKRGRSGQT